MSRVTCLGYQLVNIAVGITNAPNANCIYSVELASKVGGNGLPFIRATVFTKEAQIAVFVTRRPLVSVDVLGQETYMPYSLG